MPHSVSDILENLQKSSFRRRFQLNSKGIAYISLKGWETIAEHGRQFIRQRLGLAKPDKDGKQTPMRGHPIFIAQHATATCCRGCLAKWHSIESGKELTPKECEYILQVIMTWIEHQMTIQNPDSICPNLFNEEC